MELTLEGHTSFHVEGHVTVELPAYMRLLTGDELSEAIPEKKRELMVAAGREPKTRDVVFLTNWGALREISAEEHGLPSGDATPIMFGQAVVFGLGDPETFQVSTEWAIENSRLLVELGVLATKEGARASYV